jgi:hypothetical protein
MHLIRIMNCIVLTVFFVFGALSVNKKNITVIAGGETHGMLFPCDCPVNPGGGLAKRSYILNRERDSGDILLLDAGGFAGGGMYDAYTEGRKADSLRTLTVMSAMARMKYDAVAIGDDDLAFGSSWLEKTASATGLPLVSANCMTSDDKYLAKPFILVRKGNLTFAITGLTTQEKFAPQPDPAIIAEPFSALRKIWPEMVKKSDYRIVLSHLGEDFSLMIKDSFPECNILVNGHRKSMTDAVLAEKNFLLMQFGFSGKSLSSSRITLGESRFTNTKTEWIQVAAETPDDSGMLSFVQAAENNMPHYGVMDLYIMSQCPYGIKALREATAVLSEIRNIDWNLWFIGDVESDGSLSSLHGKKESDEEMKWLGVKALYPDQWLWFLKVRALSPDVPIDTVLSRMGMNVTSVSNWAVKNGNSELAMHYGRSMRLGIQASPTLLLNNMSMDMEIVKPKLEKAICDQINHISKLCDSIPECIDDNDCRKEGMIGTCIHDSGKPHCAYKEAVKFKFTVLLPDSLISHPEREIISTTKELFKGATIDTVRAASESGKELIEKFRPKALPFYLFDKKAVEAYNYSKIETGLEPMDGYLTFKDGYVKNVYLYKRPLVKGSCDIFIDPVFPGAKDAVAIALKRCKGLNVRISPLIVMPPSLDSLSSEERIRQEEAQRWLLISEKYPDLYRKYLDLFTKRKDESYWFLALRDLKIDMDGFVKEIKSDNSRLYGLWKKMTELGISGPVEIVIDNREVVRIKSQKEL